MKKTWTNEVSVLSLMYNDNHLSWLPAHRYLNDAATVMEGSSKIRLRLSSLAIGRAAPFSSQFSVFDPVLGPSPVNEEHWKKGIYRSEKNLWERLDIWIRPSFGQVSLGRLILLSPGMKVGNQEACLQFGLLHTFTSLFFTTLYVFTPVIVL